MQLIYRKNIYKYLKQIKGTGVIYRTPVVSETKIVESSEISPYQ